MPSASRREIARDFLYLSTARVFSVGIGVVRSLFIPRLLGPDAYGMWKSFGIAQSYIQFSDLGALASLKRQVPLLRQRGDHASLAKARDVAFFVNHVVLFAGAVALLVASFLVTDPLYRRGLRLYVLLMYALHLQTFMEQFLYWRKQFADASRVNLVLALVEALLAIGGTWMFGLDGLILGTFIGYAGAILVMLRMISFDIGFAFEWRVYVELVKIGFPSHVNGLLYNLLQSVDRILLLAFLGLESLGLYALGMTLNEYLFQFAYALGNAISPRLVERYGSEKTVESLRPMVEKTTFAIAIASPAVLGAVFFAAPAVIEMALPSFTDAILPLRILLVGTFFTSLHRGLSSFFLTIRKQARLFPAYAGAIALNTLLVVMALETDLGIGGVAAATATTLAAFSISLIVMARVFFVRRLAEHAGFTALLLAPLAWGALSVWAGLAAASRLFPQGNPALTAGTGMVVFAICYGPGLLAGYRHLKIS